MLTKSFIPRDELNERQGTGLLTYTPMFHSRLFHRDSKYRRRQFEPVRGASTLGSEHMAEDKDNSTPFLDGNLSFDRPLTVQFCSNDPDELLGAARHVAPYCDAVDLNLGCPQGIARKGHYGAFLQEDWSLVYNLINTLHRELDVPVTAKMRILDTKEKTLEYARTIVDAGASILTVHGRRREQKGHITGVADWDMIRYLRESLPPETVIFANGNILQHEDLERCLADTGADAVMSAEGNLSDPSIFAQPPPAGQEGREYWRGRDGKGGYRMDAVLRRYLEIIYKYVLETEPPQRKPLFLPGDEMPSPDSLNSSGNKRQLPKKSSKRSKKESKSQSPNLLAMQPHLFSMLRPLVSKHTHVRDALARARGGDMEAFEEVLRLTEIVTADALVQYGNGDEVVAKHAEKPRKESLPESEIKPEDSSIETVQRCWRPWWVCQPRVRPLPAEAVAKGSITLSQKDKATLKREEPTTRNAGSAPSGATSKIKSNNGTAEHVELLKEGLVCG